jgi:hypothetical protein
MTGGGAYRPVWASDPRDAGAAGLTRASGRTAGDPADSATVTGPAAPAAA